MSGVCVLSDVLQDALIRGLIALIERLFGCAHSQTTWPLSMVGERKVPTYVVCLDCGKEFRYRMPRLESLPAAVVGEEARETA